MKLSLDQSTDYSNKELYSFLKDTTLPEYVKTAEVEDVSTLSKEAFADQYNSAFPINTPANTYISNAYFMNKKADLQKMWGKNYVDGVDARLKVAASIFDISADLESYNSANLTKSAADYSTQYIYSIKMGEDEVDLFPVTTKDSFEKAAEYFVKEIGNYPFSWRFDISKSFVEKAAEFGVDELPDLLCKYAGMFYPDIEAIRQELWYRSTKLQKEASKENYNKLSEDLSNITSLEDIQKVAEVVYYTEKLEGLYENPKTAAYLRDPVDVFFSLPVEKVAEMTNVVTMAGDTYEVSALQKVSGDIYKEAFGFDIDPTDVNQLRDVLPTMPRSDVALFREISGVRPI